MRLDFSFPQGVENVVFLGAFSDLEKLIEVNNSNGIKSYVITSPDQKDMMPDHISSAVFSKLDKEFSSYINEICCPEKTLFVSLGARWIFKKEVIYNTLKNNLVNFHGTRLPFDAGGGGFSWRILNSDRLNNMLVHIVDEGVDTGAIIDHQQSIFPSYCRIPLDFLSYYRSALVDFYATFVMRLLQGHVYPLKQQVDYIGTYYPRLSTKTHAWINWDWSGVDIERFICAFDEPYEGAQTCLNNKRVHLRKAQLHGGEVNSHPYMSGLILRKLKDGIVVAVNGDVQMIVQEVIDENGVNIIEALSVGERFFTSGDLLDEAMNTRVKYGAHGQIK